MASSKRSSTKSSAKGNSGGRTVGPRDRSVTSTVSRSSKSDAPADSPFAKKQEGIESLVAAFPHNASKAREYGVASLKPTEGQHEICDDPKVIASTLSETNSTEKTAGVAGLNINLNSGSLDRVRVDSFGQALTTNQGVDVADNQSTLKGGLRGPSLLEDFILREKITHFDHERIPERIVHARGSAAHGYFECYDSLAELTRASLFSEKGKKTPVFVRFSTVAGERGSTDTARDARGFAVKFYTDEGNWDLVGNNIPVFFIQDAIKFPDLVHALKPEPHHGMPQAASAHDTFWDFVSLMPESTHMLLWVMSDRAIPRSYRMMQGFGVHTFRFVNVENASVFVKFHWTPLAGTHSLAWDEAVKISGADPDFHRRDLWEAIESGAYPEFELAVQVFTEEEADRFSFDVLDATKLVPEEMVPLLPIGKMVLNRNPDNFFAETEQVAFCTAHIVPGLDFSNDPLLAGRLHSYIDTQISRLGGPNFHEIPINSPVKAVHNNQRDGLHRQAIPRGTVAYEPNSLAGGCPFQAGTSGFTSFPAYMEDSKVRGKPEKFAEHYNQATLFWNSQTTVEKAHIINAFRFELTKVQSVGVRLRMVAGLMNVDAELSSAVAFGLGLDLPDPLPRTLDSPPTPEVTVSPGLSIFARPGDGSIRGRRVAILVSDGCDGEQALWIHKMLTAQGAVPRIVAGSLAQIAGMDGDWLDVEISIAAGPSVLYDAACVPDGEEGVTGLMTGYAQEFLKDQYRHCKPMLLVGAARALLAQIGVPSPEDQDAAIILPATDDLHEGVARFITAIGAHRDFNRETDPPLV